MTKTFCGIRRQLCCRHDIKVQLLAEHLDVQKAEREVEKRVETKQKTISHIVRHEELDVNKGTTGHVTVQDDTKTPFKRPFAWS